MTIRGLQEDDFRSILRTNLTSARAISDPRHLRGRQAKLDQIDRAFNSSGKHVFVYGDRGVGKTSLALSAAVLHQPVSRGPAEPILVSCDQSVTSFQLVRDIAKSCIPVRDLMERRRSNEGLRFNLFGLGWEAAQAIEHGTIPPIESINDAINVLHTYASFTRMSRS